MVEVVVVYAFGAALEDAVVRYRCPGIGLFACVQQREEGGALASEPLFVGHAVTSSLVKHIGLSCLPVLVLMFAYARYMSRTVTFLLVRRR